MAATSVSMAPGIGAAYQGFLSNGLPNAGGMIYTYLANTTTASAAWTDRTGAVNHTNPIVLDSSGRIPAGGEVWLDQGLSYKYVICDASGSVIQTVDYVYPAGSVLGLTGGAVLSPAFAAGINPGVAAYQKLPSGIIEQFGTVGPIASNSSSTFALPLAYTNNHLWSDASPVGAAVSTTPVAGATARPSLSTLTVYNWSSVSASFNWQSKGN